jgi:hypothetical protein
MNETKARGLSFENERLVLTHHTTHPLPELASGPIDNDDICIGLFLLFSPMLGSILMAIF